MNSKKIVRLAIAALLLTFSMCSTTFADGGAPMPSCIPLLNCGN
jgi:hypothetical protein